MLKKAIFAFLFVSLAMALPGCFHKSEVVEIEKFSNVELGFNGMKSDLVVRVYNPNYLSQIKICKYITQSRGD